MELSDLRAFRAVVAEGSITRAAEQLGRVQSAVTSRIQQLEARLDQKLFLRQGRRLVLTPAGRTLLDYAEQILALADEAEAAVHGDLPRGILRIGSMESTAAVRLPSILTEYSAQFPQVHLEMRTGNPVMLADALLKGDIDVAFVAEPVAEKRFDSVVAFAETPVIVTAETYPPFDGPDACPETILVFEHGCPHRKLLERWFGDRKDHPDRTIEIGSYHSMIGCVQAGMGAALVPESILAGFPETEKMRVTRLSSKGGSLRTLMIWPKGASSPKIDTLREIVEEERQMITQTDVQGGAENRTML